MLRERWIGLGLALAGAVVALGQQPNPLLTFEVATVKAAAPPDRSGGRVFIRPAVEGGPGTNDPSQITYNFQSLQDLIRRAYGVRNDQVSGPQFLTSERFNIVAKVARGATKDDVNVMLQNLLKERFQLAIHRENKELPVYELVVAKDGAKLKESADQSDPEAAPHTGAQAADAPPPPPPPGPPDPSKIKIGKDGMPEIPAAMRRPGVMMMAMMSPTGARVKLDGTRATIGQLVDTLSPQVDRPVIDKTGLTARYDFTLDFAPDQARMMTKMGALGVPAPPPGGGGGQVVGGPGGGDAGPRLETDAMPLPAAIQKQIGLRLEAKKDTIDLLVIDHIEKTPADN